MLPSLFSLFYVTGEFRRFLHRGWVKKLLEMKKVARNTRSCQNVTEQLVESPTRAHLHGKRMTLVLGSS